MEVKSKSTLACHRSLSPSSPLTTAPLSSLPSPPQTLQPLPPISETSPETQQPTLST